MATDLVRQRLRLLRLLPICRRPWVFALFGVELVVALIPAAEAIVIGRLIGGVNNGSNQAPMLVWFAALLVAGQLGFSLLQLVTTDVARQVDGWVRKRARDLVLGSRSLSQLEDPNVQDDLARAADLGQRGSLTRSPGAAVTAQVHLLFRIVGGLAAAMVLALYSIPLAATLVMVALVMRALVRRHFLRMSDAADALAPMQRRADYWLKLAGGAEAAKEVRLFGLAGWIAGKQRAQMLAWWKRHRAQARRMRLWQLPVAMLGFGIVLVALGVPGTAALAGDLTLAQLATCLVAAWGVLDLTGIGNQPFQIEYGGTAVRALDRLTDTLVTRPERGLHPSGGAPPVIRCEGVEFAYPGMAGPVLDGLTLEIGAGEVLGVVGDNGAGKTTLIKLLAGLYSPTAGRITVDGIDVEHLNTEEWRRRITVLFQDFVRHPASVADNVRLAAPEAHADEDAVRSALAAAGAEDLTGLLWRGGTGGHDLSGGQWQRLAFARAVFAARHGRRVVVLDEPTAHLDVAAEADFYDRVVAALPDTTVVLISHRFSAIRRADRIVLLRDGRIAESGSHAELMARDGSRYARLFALQAARFSGVET